MTDSDHLPAATLPPGALVIKRSRQVADGAQNTFGLVDSNPDPDDPAIAVAIRIAGTGERIGRVLRRGDHLTDGGLDLLVSECRTGDEPRLVLVPGSPAS